jgi:hypothetical protein
LNFKTASETSPCSLDVLQHPSTIILSLNLNVEVPDLKLHKENMVITRIPVTCRMLQRNFNLEVVNDKVKVV